ncbi:helix-turn-helix transcriptional regulator [Salmonella enterica subsp. enterica]|nr:helix-turn-helix transcriptional regulator [Salmonella enterica subsp. enterica serovar Miami]
MTNSSSAGKKVQLIRKAEGLSRSQLSEIIGISYNTLTNYEVKGIQMTEGNLMLFTQHPRFEKYTLWLMTGKTAPAAGQVAPSLSPDGQDDKKSSHSTQKAG